jgi:mitotic spindle assembly checkpoint protein MAD1
MLTPALGPVQVRTFLKNFKSIPAFMANLTMELFNKTTIG